MVRKLIEFIDRQTKLGYSNKTLNYIRLMNWFLGEFYYSRLMSRCMTSFWRILSITLNLIFLALSLSYILFTPSPSTINYLHCFNVIIICIYLGILVPVTSLVHGRRVIEALKILDESFITFPNANSVYPPEVRFVNRDGFPMEAVYTLITIHLVTWIGYAVCTLLYFTIGYTEARLQDPAAYMYPIYCENIKSIKVFCVVTCVQLLVVVPHMIIHCCEPFYLMFMVKELYSKFQLVCDSVENCSRLFLYRFENALKTYESSRVKLTLQDEFIEDIRIYVEYHEKLIRAKSHVKPYLQLSMSICLVILMYTEVIIFYIYIKAGDSSLMFKLKNVNYGITFYMIFFTGCLIGRLISEMEDMFRDTIYNIPWYYFSPRNRNFFHLLLIRAHMRLQYKALKIYTVNMTLFQRFTTQIYNVVNVIKKVMKK